MKMKWIALALVFGCALSAGAVEVTLKDTDIRLQIYGYIRADLSYDAQSTVPGELGFYVLPEVDGEKSGKTHFTARETRFGLNLFGPDFDHWKTSGKIEMDFYGGGTDMAYTPRIRIGYIDLAHSSGFSFRAGQDWETFIEVVPRIVNFSYLADAGALGLRRPQARVTQEIKISDATKVVAKAALARTVGQDLDGGGFDDGANAEWPTAQFNLALHQKLWMEKTARLAVSGHYGQETIDAVDEDGKVVKTKVEDFDTWSIQGSLFLPLTKCLAVQGNLWAGENLDVYYGGIGQGVNMDLATGIAAKGGWAQVLWDPTEKLCFAAGYSMDDPDDEDLNAGMRSKNEVILVNGSYKLTKAVTMMAEYSHFKTGYLEGEDAESDRVQLAMRYMF